MTPEPILSVTDLHTRFIYRTIKNEVRVGHALSGISFSVGEGEIVGLVGETGAGKSLAATSIMRLLRAPAEVVRGSVMFEGRDVLAMSESDLRSVRGSKMAMVVQSPKTSLDPLCRIGDQLIRIHRAHTNAGTAEARSRAIEVLDSVGIPDPARRMNAWPHELSGGMAQRVLIALALINRPRLLIADEPTTGLDVTVQAQILDLIRARVNKDRLGAIIITHDLGVVAQYCDRVLVMYAGSIVEAGPVEQVFTEPHHPYSVNLLNATPDRFKGRGSVSAGAPPDIFSLPEGCAYRANCARAGDLCHSSPALRVDGSRTVFCHYPIETAQRGSQCDIRY